ncbi:MAG: DUF1624 domain-containing protein [Oscillospiraceae bacterium]|nr:DUF1624 domain-containing protein [Oscillospiraceae bacterium]
MTKPRYHLIDALRGFSLILMLAYHFGYALSAFGLLPETVISNPLLNVLQPLFAGVFILLCGVASRFSRSNLKRGAITLACAALISAVMWYLGTPVWFGILHLLGCCMLIYAAAGRAAENIQRRSKAFGAASGAVFAALFAVCFILLPVRAENDRLAWLGLRTAEFSMSAVDYFPLGRWFFLFMLGAWIGGYIIEGRMPAWFYDFNMPFLPSAGRHTLIIYMLHQPVFYLIMTVIVKILESESP